MRREEEDTNFMILPVPYYSQREEGALQKYGNKACGLTSLRMVLDYYNKPLTIHDLSQLASRVGAYDEQQGWIHAGLVNIARDLGFQGYRIDFSKLSDQDRINAGPKLATEGATPKEIDEFMQSFDSARTKGSAAVIEELLAENRPVIASMDKDFAQTSASHLVVIIGKQGDSYLINDPWDNGKNFEVDKKRFEETWTKRVVVIFPKTN